MSHLDYRNYGPAALHSDAAFRRTFAEEVAVFRAAKALARLAIAHQLAQEAVELVAPCIGLRAECSRAERLVAALEREYERIASRLQVGGVRLRERDVENYVRDWRAMLALRAANNAKSNRGGE